MQQKLKTLKEEAITAIHSAADLESLDAVVVKYFGRKQGLLTDVLRSLKDLSENDKRNLGKEANDLKTEVWRLIDKRRHEIKRSGKQEFIDLTIDGEKPNSGHHHPITLVEREILEIFKEMGFGIMLGPEAENDYYNFESLNIPKDHPARDMFDTFYLKGSDLLLRTHTSPMQARIMEKHQPPFSVVVPGRTFRNEATDARHEHTFYQVEGLVVGEKISVGNLKATLEHLFKRLFGQSIKMQFRPSYFPFTEPSIEVLMSCIFCGQKGCSICSHTGWIEILGSGMINPKVFEYAGYEKGKYSGFAFGLGTLRIAMLKYNIPDIRMFYDNDVRFLHQF